MEQKLKIASKTDSLHLVEKFVDEFSLNCRIDNDVYGNLLIATLEAANNAITHGNKLNEEKQVELVFALADNKILLTVKDEGPGFDYKNIPDPTSPENLESMSGRGVFLMSKLSDEIEFEDNGSSVKMTFLLIKE
ncbi:MAG: ATP-binding protein [Prevotellaceae bacterium]|jgi:serine/threonine-protein kinase RsbW|nr:ATP-binding protein [Prevotellaceae bacterium]